MSKCPNLRLKFANRVVVAAPSTSEGSYCPLLRARPAHASCSWYAVLPLSLSLPSPMKVHRLSYPTPISLFEYKPLFVSDRGVVVWPRSVFQLIHIYGPQAPTIGQPVFAHTAALTAPPFASVKGTTIHPGQFASGQAVFHPPAPQTDRGAIAMQLRTGISAVDALTPLGTGQSMLILGDLEEGRCVAMDTILAQVVGDPWGTGRGLACGAGHRGRGWGEGLRYGVWRSAANQCSQTHPVPQGPCVCVCMCVCVYVCVCVCVCVCEPHGRPGARDLTVVWG